MSRLDHESVTLAVIPLYQLKSLHAVGDELCCQATSSRYDPITPLLHKLRWLKAMETIDYKFALLVYIAAPSYVADELRQPVDFEASTLTIRSASSSSLCRPSYTVINRRWPSVSGCWGSCHCLQRLTGATAARHIRAVILPVFRSRLKTFVQTLLYAWLLLCLRTEKLHCHIRTR